MRTAFTVLILSIFVVQGLDAADKQPADGSKMQNIRIGAAAPEFTLPSINIDAETGVATSDDRKLFRLSDSSGKRPVVLIFSSFT